MQPIDLTGVLKNAPIGEWLALSFARDRIVAHAPTLTAAKEAAQKLGEMRPIMMRAGPWLSSAIIPSVRLITQDWMPLIR